MENSTWKSQEKLHHSMDMISLRIGLDSSINQKYMYIRTIPC